MHGLGNDCAIIDNIEGDVSLSTEEIRKLSDRHVGIGFDQLLMVENASSKNADFRYVIFNADGSEANQCGNGARCFALYIQKKTHYSLLFFLYRFVSLLCELLVYQ